MTVSETDVQPIPPHVPADLVRYWEAARAPGGDRDPFGAVMPLRDGPPIFYSPFAHKGEPGWVVARHDLIREVFQDATTFSSAGSSGVDKLLNEDLALIPLEKDQPEHEKFRLLLNPLFSPRHIAAIEDGVRATARQLISGIRDAGECDFSARFGAPFPVTVFLRLMGLPHDHMAGFLAWGRGLLHPVSPENRVNSARAIRDYLQEKIAGERGVRGEGFMNHVANARIEGEFLSDQDALGVCYLLFVAGLDTVASTLGFIFKHLAEHPKDRKLLCDDPDLIADAIEEFLRAYAVTTSHRRVTRDITFHGVQMRRGESVTLPTMLAGRDAAEFPDPDVIDFRRQNLRHITFAAGPHRCIGSHLARREIRIAIEEWLAVISDFSLAPEKTPITYSSSVFGIHNLPLVWKVE